MIFAVITASAALVFAAGLLRLAFRRRACRESAYTGSHRRDPGQSPTPALRYALANEGHGLGLIRKSDSA